MNCQQCGSSKFTSSDGFFFCDGCGLQNSETQEFDYEQFFDGDTRQFSRAFHEKKKAKVVDDASILTSWEEYNYILLGLVNEMLSLGAKPSLKFTVLQLWTTYLSKLEVAYFSKDIPTLPRLGAVNRGKDIGLIYNRKVIKVPLKRRFKPEIDLAAKCKPPSKKRTKASLAAAEYDAFKEDHENDSDFEEMNRVDKVESTALPVEFSHSAKSVFRHLVKTGKMSETPSEQDQECDTYVKETVIMHRKSTPRYGVVTRNVMYGLIYIALNQNGDHIQLADFLRYIREGHVSFFQVKHFFPEHLQSNCEQINNIFKRSEKNVPAMIEIRRQVSQICRAIRVKTMPLPDMKRLVRRYLEDLCLPVQFYDMIERLIELCPPVMKYSIKNMQLSPNFEGRACAYILYVLKLLFGLDDFRELAISESCAAINDKLKAERPIFVFTEWMEFIEFRTVILAQCHYPSNAIYTSSTNHSASLFLDFYQNLAEKCQIDGTLPQKTRNQMESAGHIFDSLWQAHKKQNQEDQSKSPALKFDASLTPNRSYFEKILQNEKFNNLFLPPLVRVDHTVREIQPLLDPEPLKEKCRRQGIKLTMTPAQSNVNMKYVKMFYPESVYQINKASCFLNYDTEIEENVWLKQVKEKQAKAKIEKEAIEKFIEKDVKFRKNIEKKQDFLKLTKEFYEERIDDKIDLLPNNKRIAINVEPASTKNGAAASTSSQEQKPLKLVTPNYDYWIQMIHFCKLRYNEFQKLETTMPRNFQWLLKHCAVMLEMETKDLYGELLTIETQFNYVLQPTERISSTITDHCSRTVKQDLVSRINYFQGRW